MHYRGAAECSNKRLFESWICCGRQPTQRSLQYVIIVPLLPTLLKLGPFCNVFLVADFFLCLYIFFYFSDISDLGIWSETRHLIDPGLSACVPQLFDLVLSSNAPSTTNKYSYGWSRWHRRAQSKKGVPLLPAQPLHVALYLLELTEIAEQKNTGHSTIDSALFGIRWGHKIAGVESPTQHPTVIAAAEGAKRRLSRPIQLKRPLALETVVTIAQYHNTVSASLADIRFLFVLLVGYAGFFRVSELLNVSIDDIGMSVFISQRKNDQFREGHTSVIARSNTIFMPSSDNRKDSFLVARR